MSRHVCLLSPPPPKQRKLVNRARSLTRPCVRIEHPLHIPNSHKTDGCPLPPHLYHLDRPQGRVYQIRPGSACVRSHHVVDYKNRPQTDRTQATTGSNVRSRTPTDIDPPTSPRHSRPSDSRAWHTTGPRAGGQPFGIRRARGERTAWTGGWWTPNEAPVTGPKTQR